MHERVNAPKYEHSSGRKGYRPVITKDIFKQPLATLNCKCQNLKRPLSGGIVAENPRLRKRLSKCIWRMFPSTEWRILSKRSGEPRYLRAASVISIKKLMSTSKPGIPGHWLWTNPRTNDTIERLNRKIKHRTKVIDTFKVR